MQHLDLQVIRQALQWSCNGQRVWLCTVLATYGSAPRAPGSLLAVNASGQWLGSLSGGCVEDDFLERAALGNSLNRWPSCVTAMAATRVQAFACRVAACLKYW